MTLALSLSGGGPRGAFEVGAIHALAHEYGINPHYLAGTSVGAINAAFLAQAKEGDIGSFQEHTTALKQIWFEIKGCRNEKILLSEQKADELNE